MEDNKNKILIVGGVAGGASTAARLRRLQEHAQIIMFEKGEHISFANCGLPYFCSDVIPERDKLLVMTPTKFKELLNVEVRINSEVISIDRKNKTIKVLNHKNGETYEENYEKLVLSPGAKPVIPPIEGINNDRIFTVRNVIDTDKIKEFIKTGKPKTVAVIGGGFIGVEMAENLKEIDIDVHLIEASDQILAQLDYEMSAQVQNHVRDHGVNLHLGSAVSSFEQRNDLLNITLANGNVIESDFAVLSIGVKPETQIAKRAGLELGPRGHIIVNENLQTKDENIYALGDAIEVKDFVSSNQTAVPLAGPANKQGRIVAENISGVDSKYKGTQGTSILKVFDLAVATTGLSEKQLIQKEIPYLKSYTHSFSHAEYYPNPFPFNIKLLFSPEKGKVLGAQIIGIEGIDKRVDVIASTIRFKGSVSDLLELELAYAPPFGSAKDPVNIAGMTAENILKGLIKPVYWDEIDAHENAIILDVRTEQEQAIGKFNNSYSIPLEELRSRINEVPKDKKVVIYCTKGLKSYMAARILAQNGYNNVYTLNGGYSIYKQVVTNKIGVISMNKEKEESESHTKIAATANIKIDACGLSCPGPIMKLADSIKQLEDSQVVEITTTDAGFKTDVVSWAKSTGNKVLEVKSEKGIIKAQIQKGNAEIKNNHSNTKNKRTLVVFSNDLDKAMASFIIANGAKASGSEVTMFFTFWGINILRKDQNINIKKGLLDKMFGFMMPKGADKLTLSKMNMAGLGTNMMKHVMKSKNVPSITELIQQAQKSGIKLIACQMAMDVMGIQKEELLDGVEVAGVAHYLNEAEESNTNLFI